MVYLFNLNYVYDLIECINKLDSTVHNDPLLDLYRGSIFSKNMEYLKAYNNYYNNIIEYISEYSYGYIGNLKTLLKGEKFEKALNLLIEMKSFFGYSESDIIYLVRGFPKFQEYKDYKEWP